jgi:phage terminase small subunit
MNNLTPKQEAFARIYVETSNASEAYRQCADVAEDTKPESIWASASRMLSDVKVLQRVDELQKEAAERTLVTVARLMEELEEARALALAEKQSSAAVSATMGKARINGLLVEKREIGGLDGKPLKFETADRSPRDVAKAVIALMTKAEKTNELSG